MKWKRNWVDHTLYILFYFNARQVCEKFVKMMRWKVHQCQKWFTKFRLGNFDITNAPLSGRLVELYDDQTKALIEANTQLIIPDVAEKLYIYYSTIHDHLNKHKGSIRTQRNPSHQYRRYLSQSRAAKKSNLLQQYLT